MLWRQGLKLGFSLLYGGASIPTENDKMDSWFALVFSQPLTLVDEVPGIHRSFGGVVGSKHSLLGDSTGERGLVRTCSWCSVARTSVLVICKRVLSGYLSRSRFIVSASQKLSSRSRYRFTDARRPLYQPTGSLQRPSMVICHERHLFARRRSPHFPAVRFSKGLESPPNIASQFRPDPLLLTCCLRMCLRTFSSLPLKKGS